jgi:diaminopimelate epimerase
MHGAGNKILVADLRGVEWRPDAEWARSMNGVTNFAFDQLMTIERPSRPGVAADIEIFNNDGSTARACGNGTRCVADVLIREAGGSSTVVATRAADIVCERLSTGAYRVDMGRPAFSPSQIPIAWEVPDTSSVRLARPDGRDDGLGEAALASIGNPHAVFFVPDLSATDVGALGPTYETHPIFLDKANISFVQLTGRDSMLLKVWERGAGATLACGSGACATLVCAVRRGLANRKASVLMPGGELTIEWRADDDHVLLSGPVGYERTAIVAVGDRSRH